LLCIERGGASIISALSMHFGPLPAVTLIAAGAAALVLVRYLVVKPRLDLRVKLMLLLGLGVLPAISAGASTVAGMETTTHRTFCGSCHVMSAHFADTGDPKSQSLAARHSRNPFFGDRSCYVCHADYGMLGYVLTKAGGLRHVYLYYLGGYRQMTLEQAEREIHLIKPYDNTNCRQCHTETGHDWKRVPDHRSLEAELRTNKVSCASVGCHGYAHPFNKQLAAAEPAARREGRP
jgi:nitrate/TMAO reductase-like tetraheme cytochrome c subunit